jgi:hypothetical protein
MIQVVFWLAVACAVLGALTRNRTAVMLLASALLCLGMNYVQVPFNFVVWMLIDLAVVSGIIHYKMTRTDCVIIALFIPAWCFYLLPAETRFWGTFVVVVAQLALTFPVDATRRILTSLSSRLRPDNFDKMVAHA